MNSEINALLIHEQDNVVVVLEEMEPGQTIRYALGESLEGITATNRIPLYHKVARQPIAAGHVVFKYGDSIGAALRNIEPGEHVHEHNLGSLRDDCLN